MIVSTTRRQFYVCDSNIYVFPRKFDSLHKRYIHTDKECIGAFANEDMNTGREEQGFLNLDSTTNTSLRSRKYHHQKN